MKRFFNGLLALCMLSMLITAVSFVCYSCANKEDDFAENEARHFLYGLKEDFKALSKVEINSTTRGLDIVLGDSIKNVKVWCEGVFTPEEREKIERTKTLGELMTVANEVGAVIRTTDGLGDNLTRKDYVKDFVEVNVSEVSAKLNMQTLIAKSKEFLRARGLSDNDMNVMLSEDNADECALVPLALSMAECENSSYIAQQKLQMASSYSIFATQAYAAVDWGEVWHCTKYALGIDIVNAIVQNGTRKWTKVLIKKMFKTMVSRTCTPVAAVIVTASFVSCMNGYEIF